MEDKLIVDNKLTISEIQFLIQSVINERDTWCFYDDDKKVKFCESLLSKLENMKKFENFTKEDLKKLREQVVLNSCFTSDFSNDMGISATSASAFFDGYYDYLWEIAKESGADNITHKDIMDKYDTTDNLWSWFNCYGDFDWVEYD